MRKTYFIHTEIYPLLCYTLNTRDKRNRHEYIFVYFVTVIGIITGFYTGITIFLIIYNYYLIVVTFENVTL